MIRTKRNLARTDKPAAANGNLQRRPLPLLSCRECLNLSAVCCSDREPRSYAAEKFRIYANGRRTQTDHRECATESVNLIVLGSAGERSQLVNERGVPTGFDHGDIPHINLRCHWCRACRFVAGFRAGFDPIASQLARQIQDLLLAGLSWILCDTNPAMMTIQCRRIDN